MMIALFNFMKLQVVDNSRFRFRLYTLSLHRLTLWGQSQTSNLSAADKF